MAQTNYTPISLYYSTTAAAVPTSGNLVAGELALNTVDEKLYFKNSAGTVKQIAGAGVGGIAYTAVKTANYTAANNDGVLTNTTAAGFTVTLPTSPSVGNQIIVADSFGTWGTNNLTIDPTALIKIAGQTAGTTLTCNINSVAVTLVYTGATYGWDIFAQIGANDTSVLTQTNTVSGITNKTFVAPVLGAATGTSLAVTTTGTALSATTDAGNSFLDGITTSSGARINIDAGSAANGPTIWSYNNARNAYVPLNIGASAHIWKLGATEALRLNTTGNLVLQGGTTSANGIGITFPAAQSASTDANTLDDYEEGTWTPSVTSSGGTITTVGAVTGNYRKIGSFVCLFFSITITTNGTGSNQVVAASVPFSFATSAPVTGMGQEVANVGFGLTLANSGNTSFGIRKYDASYPAANGYVLVGSIAYYMA